MSRLRSCMQPLSQAAIAGADLTRNPEAAVALHAERYIPQRLLEKVSQDICGLYGLQGILELTATHPESELQKSNRKN